MSDWSTSEKDHSSPTKIGTSQSDDGYNIRSVTTTTTASREDQRPDRGSLMWSRPILSIWHTYKQVLMKLKLQTVRFAADAKRMLNGARLSVNWLYSSVGVEKSTSALRQHYGWLTLRPWGTVLKQRLGSCECQDVRKNHGEQIRPGKILTKRAPTGHFVKIFRQVRVPPAHVKKIERASAYPKQETQEGDAERYGELRLRIDETILAAYVKAEMRKSRILVILNSDFVNNPESLLWPDVITLIGTDLDWMQPISTAIGFQRQTEMIR